MSSHKSIKVLHWNANSIQNKITELLELLKRTEVDVVVLCETFLNPDASLYIPDFKTYRCNRNSRGGGVSISVRKSIVHSELPHFVTHGLENVNVILETKHKSIRLSSVYCPKYTRHFKDDLRILTSGHRDFFVFGDLNARHRSWNCVGQNTAGKALFEMTQTGNFFVHPPSDPTYYPTHANRQPSVLDVTITNSTIQIELPLVLNELSSDHSPVLVEIIVDRLQSNEYMRPDYKNADWRKFSYEVDTLLQKNAATDDIDADVETFTNAIKKARDIAVPLKRNFNKTMELSTNTKDLIKLRNAKKRQWQQTRSEHKKAEMNFLNKIIKTNVTSERNQHFQNTIAAFEKGDRKYWRMTKILRGKQARSSAPLIDGTTIIHTASGKANLLADTFAKSHTLTAGLHHPQTELSVAKSINDLRNKSIEVVDIAHTTPGEISELIKTLKPLKAPGTDNLQNTLLKHLPVNAVTRLSTLFSACLRQGYFPNHWKHAKVVAIPKANKKRTLPSSYRPISLLNVLGKLFEIVIQKRLREHLDAHNILPPQQFGFRAQHSTCHQALRITNYIEIAKQNRKSTGAIFLDIEKAFDSVWHDGLVHKLITTETPTYLVKIIDSFLKKRTFAVSIPGATSSSHPIPAGVPQGSVLSPTLYNVFTADIPTPKYCHIATYADDTAVYCSSLHSNAVGRRLDKALVCLERYFERWKIRINITKTQAIFFPFRRRAINRLTHAITHNGTQIEWSKSVTYLGIELDQNLTYKHHTNRSIEKDMEIAKVLYPLTARSSRLSFENKLLIFKCITRPMLIYGCPVWRNMAQTHHRRLQIAQNRALKRVLGVPPWYNTDRLNRKTNMIPLRQYIDDTIISRLRDRTANSDYQLIRDLNIN